MKFNVFRTELLIHEVQADYSYSTYDQRFNWQPYEWLHEYKTAYNHLTTDASEQSMRHVR